MDTWLRVTESMVECLYCKTQQVINLHDGSLEKFAATHFKCAWEAWTVMENEIKEPTGFLGMDNL